jgi:hypothetical protein
MDGTSKTVNCHAVYAFRVKRLRKRPAGWSKKPLGALSPNYTHFGRKLTRFVLREAQLATGALYNNII